MADDRLAIVHTLPIGATTQADGYDFNSMGMLDYYEVAVNESGIYKLTGNSFGDDDINAYFEIYVDFLQDVRLWKLMFSLEASGNLLATVTFNDKTARPYTVTPNLTSNKQTWAECYVDAHVDYGQFMRLRVASVDGSDFSIDAIDAVVVPLGRKRYLAT